MDVASVDFSAVVDSFVGGFVESSTVAILDVVRCVAAADGLVSEAAEGLDS